MNVIEIRDLTYTYPGASRPTLDHLNLNVEKGDFLAIIGNNGCGKSTLCKTMNGLIPHFIAGEFQGSVLVDQQDTRTMDVGRIAGKVGYVYQDFENQIVRPTVLDDASYACMNYAMPDYLERGREALRQCGLEGREQEYIWQLSGGQTHLLALAGAVSLEPDVLILDEPIAQLDPKHADLIYGVLKNLNETWGKTIIVIEHHTEYIADYCHHVALLKDGHTEWVLPSDEALRRVEELQECNIFPPQVTIAAQQMKKEGMLAEDTVLPTTIEAGKKVFDRLLYRGEICTEWEAPGEKQKETETVVSFRKVSVSYRAVKGEAKQIFRNLNLEIKKGEKIALIGSNGAGKSTLMKLMTGLIKPSEGEILLKGKGIRDTKPEALSKMISLVYQNPEEMFIKDSIERDIAFAMEARNTENWQERTKALLEQFRLTELKDRDGRLLSGGQMRRASLAIGIALNPEILLLDEPTSSLDPELVGGVLEVIRKLAARHMTMLLTTHEMDFARSVADRVIFLADGRIQEEGTPAEIFDHPQNPRLPQSGRRGVFVSWISFTAA